MQISKDLEAIAKVWYNFPTEGAKARDLIGSVQTWARSILAYCLVFSLCSKIINFSEVGFVSSDPKASRMGNLKQVLQLQELQELIFVLKSG